MAEPQRTQKQIAERFKGNLDYFKKPHYLRRARFWCSFGVLVAGLAGVVIYHQAGPQSFYSSGPLSSHHAHLAQDCQACHEPSNLRAQDFKQVEQIDQSCQKCHTRHAHHQPNVPFDMSCSACHTEHQGQGPMAAPADRHCLECHGDSQQMALAGLIGDKLPEEAFAYRASRGLRIFSPERPEGGRTNVFQSFADHPDFQYRAGNLREVNTLRFNHQRHFESDIPEVNGRTLDCAFCHTTDASGAFFQRMEFEQHCQICHSLSFDPEVPGLSVPHGNPEHVRAFLRSLPVQYADHADQLGLEGGAAQEGFVNDAMSRLRDRFQKGEALEEQVFFSNQESTPVSRVAGGAGQASVRMPGCAYCHPVRAAGDQVPIVTAPVIPDRWLVRGDFNHAKHQHVDCTQCHAVYESQLSSDILLPSKESCTTCHMPGGPADDHCALCHDYHAKPDDAQLKLWRTESILNLE